MTRVVVFVCLVFSLSACSYHRDLPVDAGCTRKSCRDDDDSDRSSPESDAGDGGVVSARAPDAAPLWPEPGGPAGEVVREPTDLASQHVFVAGEVKTYEIEVSAEDLAKIDKQPSAEEYVTASLTIGGDRIENIGMRYKGSAGAFTMPCTSATQPGRNMSPKAGKCSIKLAFDYMNDDGRFYGLKKLNLHAMGRDRSFMREQLGYAMFREMGVAAPRTSYVRLVINGKLEGLFLAVEQIDGRFTRSRFSEGGEGNLYKEVWPLYNDPARYRAALESNKGETTNVNKMLAFALATWIDPALGARWVDRDYTMRYFAVDRVLQNDDGVFHWYCSGSPVLRTQRVTNHNFYWYEAERAGRMWLVPWDLDVSLVNEPRTFIDVEWSAPADCACHTAVGFPQRAPSCDPLTAHFATWRADYDKRVDDFINGPFATDAVEAKLATWADQIAPIVDEAAGIGAAPTRDQWQAAITTLRNVLDDSRKHRGNDYSAMDQ